jgi:hypothetical protein
VDPPGERGSDEAREQIRLLQLELRQRGSVLDSLLEQIELESESLLVRGLRDAITELEDAQQLDRGKLLELRESGRGARIAAPRPRRPPHAPRPPSFRKTVGYDMFRFREDVEIRADEKVNGDIWVVGGNLYVDGEVDGDAIVLGGNLNVGRRAIVSGRAWAVGGRLEASPGAEVAGQTVSLVLLPTSFTDAWPHWFSLVLDFLTLGFLMLVAGLFLIVVPERFALARELLGESFLRCFGVGLLALTGGVFAVVVSMTLLTITVIGIPAALLVAFSTGLLLLASLLVGVILIGDRLGDALRLPIRTPLVSIFLGLILVLSPEILADVVRIAFPAVGRLGFGLLSFLMMTAVVAAGLGALVLSRLGTAGAGQPSQATR